MPTRRTRKRGFRWITGIAALAFAAVTAACAPQQSGIGLQLVSPQQVQQMGAKSWQSLREKQPATDNQAFQDRARRISDRVLSASGHNPQQWEVVVFKGDEANAFALPGGKIGVYEGMMKLADKDAELAAVIGHEIAHVDREHATQRVNSEMTTRLGIDIASAVLGASDVAQPETVAALLGAGAQYGLLLPYSRNQELEADRNGLNYMARAGYDPRASVDLWQKMSQRGDGPPVFLSTHPGHSQRIQQFENLMPEALEIYRANAAKS